MIIHVNKISEKGISLNDSVEIDGNSLLEKDSSFLEELNYQISSSGREPAHPGPGQDPDPHFPALRPLPGAV